MAKSYKKISHHEKNRVLDVLGNYGLAPFNVKPTITRNTVAFVNKIYLIEKNGTKYILRESRPGTERNHIVLEAELLDFLRKKKFFLAPSIIKNNNGEYITYRNGLFYIVQTFMPGKTKANWDNLTLFTLKKLKSFFTASALFSKAVKNFCPKTQIQNTQLADYVEDATNGFEQRILRLQKSWGRTLLEKSSGPIRNFIHQTQKEFTQTHYRRLPTQLVHFDFHPGNVNFIGDKVTGIFDYDWVRFDSRITDIAGTIAQACYYYGGSNGGLYRKDRIQVGLQEYRKVYGRSEYSRDDENYLIKIALKGYIIFQLLFAIDEYAANITSKRHKVTLDHFVKLVVANDYDFLFE